MPAQPHARPVFSDLVDTHCHLDYAPMAESLDETLAEARAAGVRQIVHIGCSAASHDRALALIDSQPDVYGALGIHPHEAASVTPEAMVRLGELAKHPKVLAIGETGLDYFYGHAEREAQLAALRSHVELAVTLGKPLVLHIRDAHEDALELLGDYRSQVSSGIVHCFTGTAEQARLWIARGFYLSFSGIVTFRKSSALQEAAQLCALDRMLLETDAPYLAPEPLRGRKNVPANVSHTCAFLAELRGVNGEDLAAKTSANARALLRLPEPL